MEDKIQREINEMKEPDHQSDRENENNFFERRQFCDHLRSIKRLRKPSGIFCLSESILDTSVQQLPSTEYQLLQIKGIGLQKYIDCDQVVIDAVHNHKKDQLMSNRNNNKRQRLTNETTTHAHNDTININIEGEGDNNDDDNVVIKTLHLDRKDGSK